MTREAAISKYEWVEPVPFTNDAAAEAADVYVELHSNGEMINKSDIYTAGTARNLGVPLVVADNDFDVVSELDIEVYQS
jgi:predicted nucleic acid-binding protein